MGTGTPTHQKTHYDILPGLKARGFNPKILMNETMTKREQIAAKMMAALVARCDNASAERMARGATRYADALLAELELPPTSEDSSAVEADKDGWIPHKPGDPMPCKEGAIIRIRLRNGEEFDSYYPENYEWGEIPHDTDDEIIAWKPAK